jgi:hypothetical protein
MNSAVRITSTNVLGHVVGAERDEAAVALQVGDPGRQPTTGGDGRVECHGGAGRAQRALLRECHAATVRRHQAVRQEALAREVLGRRHAALLLDRRHLAPDLVQVHRGQDPQAVLQLARAAEQLGRGHVGRPHGQPRPDPAIGHAVPAPVQGGDTLEPGLAERAVDLERARLADRRPATIPRALAQEQAQAGVGEGVGVRVDPAALLERQRGAAADGLERAEPDHRPLLVRRELRRGQGRQAADEGRRVRGRKVLVDAARENAGEVCVRVGQAGEDGPPATVDTLGVRMASEHLGRGPERGDAAAGHGDRGVVVDRPRLVGGDDRRVVNDDVGRAHGFGRLMAATGVGSSSGSMGTSTIAGLPAANASRITSPTWSGCST